MGESDLTNSLANDMRHLSCRPDARKTVAIICSENTKTKAEKLNVGNSIQDSQCSNFKREIIVCKDLECFSDELLNRCQKFYILVDSSLMAIVMSKRNFHSEVDEFFESVEKNGKKVLVCRDLGPNENDDAIDFYARLPRKCRLWYNKVELNFLGSSNSTSEDGGNDVQLEEKEKEEKLDEEKVKEEKLDEEKAKEEKLDEEKVKEEKLDEEKVKEGKLDEEKVKEEKLDEKEEEEWDEEEATTAITSGDPGVIRCVQVGSHLTMKVTSTSSKPLKIEQYGDNNAVSIKIGPKVKNNVRFVVNSEQLSNEDEETLTTDLKEDECLKISVKSSGCTSLSFTKGSIIIEMDVEPGTSMDKDWLFSLFTLLFEERLRKFFPEGISLDVEVEKTWTVTLQEIELAKKSDLHALCVPKEKYDELLEENTELKGKITATERRHRMNFLLEQYEELLKENLELSREIEETIFEDYPWSLSWGTYGELLRENRELSRKMRETIFEDYPRSLQLEKYEKLLRENLELSRKVRDAVFEDYPRSHQREKYGELVKENRELSRNMRETIFEDYPRSLQREKYEQFLKKSIELSSKMREIIIEDCPRNLQYEKYEELLREKLELSRKMREAMFEHRQSRFQPREYEELMNVDQEWSTKSEGPMKRRTGSEHVEEEFPEKGIRAEGKRYVTERPRSLKGLESPGTEQSIEEGMSDWNMYRKENSNRFQPIDTIAEPRASMMSQFEGPLTKGGKDFPSQSK